jgi:hypothetical protein
MHIYIHIHIHIHIHMSHTCFPAFLLSLGCSIGSKSSISDNRFLSCRCNIYVCVYIKHIYMYIYHIYMYIYIHLYIYTHTHTHTHTHIHIIYIHIIYIHTCICTLYNIYTYNMYIYNIYTYIYIHNIYIYVHVCICVCTCIHMYTKCASNIKCVCQKRLNSLTYDCCLSIHLGINSWQQLLELHKSYTKWNVRVVWNIHVLRKIKKKISSIVDLHVNSCDIKCICNLNCICIIDSTYVDLTICDNVGNLLIGSRLIERVVPQYFVPNC